MTIIMAVRDHRVGAGVAFAYVLLSWWPMLLIFLPASQGFQFPQGGDGPYRVS